MTTIAQEIATFEAKFEQGLARWNALSTRARRSEWNKYLDTIDRGGAGWTTFSLVLNSPCQQGSDPSEGLVMGDYGVIAARAEAPA